MTDTDMSYETMWEIVFKLASGSTQGHLARKYGVKKAHINAIAKDYDVGRRPGQSRRSVQKESLRIDTALRMGEKPDLKINSHFAGQKFTLRVKKYLLGPEEKAQIIAGMKAAPGLSAIAYAQEFKRLPATIVKIAAEAGITLR